MKAAGAPAAAPAAPHPAAVGGQLETAAQDSRAQARHGWTVSVRGDAARRWALRRTPDDAPPFRSAAAYRVTLDGAGRVVALARVSGPADPRVDAFVRGMVFEPLAPATRPGAGTAGDVTAAVVDFEIDLAPR